MDIELSPKECGCERRANAILRGARDKPVAAARLPKPPSGTRRSW